MTELEHIEIEGFKGIEHVEFEPTDINLITGRNNTGKTSFLESLDLAFQPENIANFDADLSKVVNIHFEKANVWTEDKHIQLRYPTKREARNYLATALSELLAFSAHWQRTITSFQNEDTYPEWIDDERLNEALTKSSTHTIRRFSEDLLSNINNICIVIEVDGKSYPYVRFGSQRQEILLTSQEELKDALAETFTEFTVDSTPGRLVLKKGASETKSLFFEIWDNMSIEDGRLLNEPPESSNILTLQSREGWIDANEISNEENAIKIDDIGDYIKKTGLVENLKTFNLDYLVFEEDGEKYDIPFDFMGDGFKSIVGLLWELMDDDVENEIVLIEEPENHMHPGYVSELVHFLIDLARDEDIQFFITTHDHDFIKDFFAEMPEEKREYLEDEFSLIKMDDFGADVLNYEDAEHHLRDLHLDLRGI